MKEKRDEVEEGIVEGGGKEMIRDQKKIKEKGVNEEKEDGIKIVSREIKDKERKIKKNEGEEDQVIVGKIIEKK